MKPQLCLGTVQFGMSYGITNPAGQVPEDAVSSVLREAREAGICWLDTAHSYGNAEEVLGRQLKQSNDFRLISKLPAQSNKSQFTFEDTEGWDQNFRASCKRLGRGGLDALLLHAPTDLLKPGGKYLEDWLLGLRKQGLVRRLGVSIYSAQDLEALNPDLLDLVQLPLSLLDQRLLQDGTISRLHAMGTAIHARSVYLQGLLLTSATQWPSWVSAKQRAHQQALESFANQRGCGLIDLALGFAQEQTKLEAVVVGVCNLEEFRDLLQAWKARSPWQESEWQTWAMQDTDILDPRCWPR